MAENVIRLEQRASAKAIHRRLWNPPNARNSTELEIVTESSRRKRDQVLAQQEAEARRAEEVFRREVAIDDLIRAELADHQLAKGIAAKLLVEEKPFEAPQLSMRIIIEAVADHYEIALIDLLSERRAGIAPRARQVAMYLLRNLTTRSLPQIGRHLGGRDHTTVHHGVRRIEVHLKTDADLREDIEAIKSRLGVA